MQAIRNKTLLLEKTVILNPALFSGVKDLARTISNYPVVGYYEFCPL
jgi:hypothetical protein